VPGFSPLNCSVSLSPVRTESGGFIVGPSSRNIQCTHRYAGSDAKGHFVLHFNPRCNSEYL